MAAPQTLRTEIEGRPVPQHPKRERAYRDAAFLNSPEARQIRLLAEFLEPEIRFRNHSIESTFVVWGSARARPMIDAQEMLRLAQAAIQDSDTPTNRALLTQAEKGIRLADWYHKVVELSRRLAIWGMEREKPFHICTGGGPGFMQAANEGAWLANAPNIGLAITLPKEEGLNPFVTPELAWEFHYFMMRKFHFLYRCKALILCPGGFGSMDEGMELLTLRQTGKIHRPLPTVLFGADFWNAVFGGMCDVMDEWGTISPQDRELVTITDSVDEAFSTLTTALQVIEQAGVNGTK